MPSFSRNEIILVRYPFSDLTSLKVRPAVVVHVPHPSRDLIIVPLTSRVATLLPGEFVLADWAAAGLRVATAVKRGIFTIHDSLAVRPIGALTVRDANRVTVSVRGWLGL